MLIKRKPHPTDRRRWLLHLMPTARNRLEQAGEYGDVTHREALAGVSEADRQHLLKTLQALKANLTEACDAPLTAQKRASHG
jgi:MarR family transcriptional regulator, transcriptional regulator for hemolysin